MKSVVLLSAGLDSTYNLLEAKAHGPVLTALTFDYGQRAAKRELACARRQCEELEIPHTVIELNWFSLFTHTSLIKSEAHLPLGTEIAVADAARSAQTAKAVWVPNRNGIFLNIAAGFAEGLGADAVVPGFNFEEAQSFADNSKAFIAAIDNALSFSTQSQVKLRCFSTELNKAEIVSRLLKLQANPAAGGLRNIWPCYQGEPIPCGRCESCLRFDRALVKNKIDFNQWRAETCN